MCIRDSVCGYQETVYGEEDIISFDIFKAFQKLFEHSLTYNFMDTEDVKPRILEMCKY